MSWGIKIALLYGGFVVLILSLVFRSGQENIDLESADYYARELKFQEQIDGRNAVSASGVNPVISLNTDVVIIAIPEQLAASTMKGTVQFYRPDDAAKDKTFEMNGAAMEFSSSGFATGRYTVRMNWNAAGEDYFFETHIYIP